ncbi:hypothetical protein [Bernardetia sp.]|uniref:hypothetical protein n=1 Tax=Bernardetia sp. TaxID=1937974 RepID=UPI0025B9B893|nr:hypothetical protein [Bernardetia sp.]
MEILEKEIEKKGNILELQKRLQNEIGKFCKEKDFKISYTELNAVLIKLLHNNNEYELKGLIEEAQKEEGKNNFKEI